jgi:hypothetical protein
MDVRVPIGGLFSLLGLIVAAYGMATGSDAAMYQKSESVNINLWWGLVMIAFGLVMLALARRGRAKSP